MASRTAIGEAATRAILSVFRLNGLLLEAGDRLSFPHGLTSARWQVLGAIALSERSLTVPQIARRMGLTRQSVRATIDRLIRDGVVELAPNDDHRRSQLVRITGRGSELYGAVDGDQAVWVNDLARGIGRKDLDTTRRVLDELVRRLEARRAKGSPTRTARAAEGADR